MATKVVIIPGKLIPIFDENQKQIGEKSIFIHLLEQVLGSVQHKSKTDTGTIHRIDEKIEPFTGKNAKVPKTLEFEDNELEFLDDAIEKLYKEGAIRGRGWYHLIDPLRSAQPRKKA